MSDVTDGSGAGGSAESLGTSRSASSTPRPARGQLWERRYPDGNYAVVVRTFSIGLPPPRNPSPYSVEVVSYLPQRKQEGERQFVQLSKYIGNFEGSRWLYNDTIVTVSLPLAERFDEVDVMVDGNRYSYGLRYFLKRARFQSLGPASTRRAQSPRRTTAEAVRAVFGEDISSESEDEIDDSATSEDDDNSVSDSENERALREFFYSDDDDVPPRLSPPDPVALADGSGAGGEATSSSSTSRGTKRKRTSEREPKVGDRWTTDAETIILVKQRDLIRRGKVQKGFMALSETSLRRDGTQRVRFITKAALLNYSYKDSAFAQGAKWRTERGTTATVGQIGKPNTEDTWYISLRYDFSSTTMPIRKSIFRNFSFVGDEEEKRQMPKKLMEAIQDGNIDAVKNMIKEKKLDVNKKFRLINMTTTPLKLLVTLINRNSDPVHMRILELLLESGANVREALAEQQRRERSSAERPSRLLLKLLEYNTVDQSECPICLEPLGRNTSLIIKLSCGHMFHKNCIRRHAQSSRYRFSQYFKCPTCRKDIRKSELNGDGDIFIAAKTDADGNIVYKLTQILKF